MMERVIFFDGVCEFCSFWVRFVIARDPKKRFRFTPLQSPLGLQVVRALGLPEEPPQSVILKEGGRYYLRSSATLRILRQLSGLWPLLYAFLVIPAPIRDVVYNLVARNRYRWFGKKEVCFVPTLEIRERFL